MNSYVEKVRQRIIWMSRVHWKLYVICYSGAFVLLIVTGSFFPETVKGFLCPLLMNKQEETGIIEEKRTEEIQLADAKRPRIRSYDSYFFVVDGNKISVRGSDYAAYSEGDSFDYYLYRMEGYELASDQDYQLGTGTVRFLLSVLCFLTALFFILTETSERKLKEQEEWKAWQEENKKTPGKKENRKYGEYSVGALGRLCEERNIKTMPGKRKNRQYLENCLRQKDEDDNFRMEQRLKNRKYSRLLNVLCYFVLIVVLSNLMRHVYYLVQLFL